MTGEICIGDLAAPVYSELQRGALDYGASLEVELNRDSILREARARSGLADFGPGDFTERLDILLDAWNADRGLNNLGRLNLRSKLLQHLTSRLLIQDCWRRHPEILDIEIREPIIVVGLPRSGTTHLLNLMGADQRLRSLPLWESCEPVPLPGESLPADGEYPQNDPRYQRCSANWDMMQQMTPYLAAMHPMNPDHIHEELELMGPDIASYNYEWLSPCPTWRDHYYATDQTPHYEYMKNVLKLMLWQQRTTARPTRWVLKCPQHLEQMPVLQKVFPDATFVVTHRDPVAVIQSTVTMLGYGQRMNRHRVELQALIEYWSDRVEHLLRACVRDRDNLPPGNSIDVLFHEFMADDLATVEKIYAGAELEMTAAAGAQLRGFIEDNPRGKHGRMIYDLQADFGVAPDHLRRRFAFYFDRFPVKSES